MIKLNGHYQGFKIGMRVGDSLIAQVDIDSPLGEALRHALKNVAVSSKLEAFPEVFAVGGVFHAPKEWR